MSIDDFVRKYYTPNNLEYSKLASGFLLSMSNVYSHRTITSFGEGPAKQRMREYVADIVDKMRPGRAFAKFVVLPEEFFGTEEQKMFLEQAVRNAMNNASRMNDSASIVFAHSVLDTFSADLLIFGAKIDAAVYFRFIKERQIKVFDLLTEDFGSIDSDGVNHLLTAKVIGLVAREWTRDSLCAKIDHLHSICPPPRDLLSEGSYKYDKSRIEKIDRRRHSIVHGLDYTCDADSVTQDLYYMLYTGVYLALLMHLKFDLKWLPVPSESCGDGHGRSSD